MRTVDWREVGLRGRCEAEVGASNGPPIGPVRGRREGKGGARWASEEKERSGPVKNKGGPSGQMRERSFFSSFYFSKSFFFS